MTTTTTTQTLLRNDHHTVPFISSGGNNSGDVIAFGSGRIAVVAGLEAVADTETGAAYVLGQFDIKKNATSDTYAVGDQVFFDTSNHVAKTAWASGYLYAGTCVKASANGDVYVYTDINVRLAPRFPVAAVTGAGSVIGDAAQLIEGFNVVAGADDTVGVILPVAAPGMTVLVKSTVSNKILKVWPKTGGTINALSASAAMSLASGPTPAIFVASSATQWYTIPLLPS